jgi:hypothetical protein
MLSPGSPFSFSLSRGMLPDVWNVDSEFGAAFLRVVGLAGSLRQESYNCALLLRAAQSLAPPELEVEVHNLALLPFYNQDLDTRKRRHGGRLAPQLRLHLR